MASLHRVQRRDARSRGRPAMPRPGVRTMASWRLVLFAAIANRMDAAAGLHLPPEHVIEIAHSVRI